MDEQDPEFVALTSVAKVLEPLDINTRMRVLTWAHSKFVVQAQIPEPKPKPRLVT